MIRSLFNSWIRPHLPPKVVRLSGITAFAGSIADLSLQDNPDYEREAIDALREHVREGDAVRIVGCGVGVTAAVALEAGAETVEGVDPAERQVACARKTVDQISRVGQIKNPRVDSDRWRFVHGHIGSVEESWGAGDHGRRLCPEWVSYCDVLELDCEGAEREILKAMRWMNAYTPEACSPLPRVAIVETHRHLGSSLLDVTDLLEDCGYAIEKTVPVSDADEEGVFTVVATRDE